MRHLRSRARLPLWATLALWGVLSSCMRTPAVPAFPDPRCRQAYTELFASPTPEIRIVFGYKDTRPARFVADRYERLLFIEHLGKRGFARSAEDSELFTRAFTGPDGKPRTLKLRVTGSSAGPDDKENRLDPFQAWMSGNARSSLLQGLTGAAAVFYNGHSRAGGGPDFAPPRLGSREHVAYGWYRERKPGLRELRDGLLSTGLKGESPRVRVLGLFSCASSEHFSRELLAAKKDLGLIATRELLYFSDALKELENSLSALLEMKCQPDFERLLRSGQAGTQLNGFFGPGAS